MKKILFFDVDDTLIHHRGDKSYIPESTKKAIKKLKDNEYIIAIASGRGHVHIKHIMEMLGIDHAVCFNGHMLVVDNEIVYRETLHESDMKKLVSQLKRNIFPVLAMDEEKVYVKDFLGKVKKTLTQHVNTVEGSDFNLFDGEFHRLERTGVGYFGMMFFNRYFRSQSRYEHLSFKAWGTRGFEVANQGTSKLTGILAMAERFGIDREHIYVFGDNYNDIEMLEGIENSVAMGNAVDAAKAAASYTTAHVGEDGIEKACYYFGLID